MKCLSTKTNGATCKANAVFNSQYCFHHNPDISREVKKEAQARGGSANRAGVKEPLPPIEITKLGDVVALLGDTVKRVRSGEMDLKVATTLGYLSGHLLKAFEVTDLEARFEELEKKIAEK